MHEGVELAGRYRLEGLLGRGGMGEVWSARDLRLGRAVAVKVLPGGAGADPVDVARFRREAEIAAGLQHPGITVVFDIGEDGSTLFLVMELLMGSDLATILSDHPHGLAVLRVLSMADQLAGALAAAHARGVVHRDIKPANVMVLNGDRLKICDFGIARFGASTSNLTGRGVIGTPAYMAPEQFEGKIVDGRTDLYALGCVIHELLTGVPPFRVDRGVGALMHAHLALPPPSPRGLRPDVPVGLDRLVIDLLAKDPARRPADAAMVQERLRVIGDERVSAARRRRRRPPTVASAPRAGHDVETDVTLSFREAVEGATVPIRLKMQDVMPVRTWRVRFPAGIADGQRVRLKGKGMPGMDGGPDGDLYVVMHVSPHPVFGRSGEDLTSTVPITAEEARTGAEIAVPVLTHPFRVTLRIPAGTPDGQVFRLPGCGVTRREGGAGAMLVTVQVLHGLANVPGGGPAARMDLIQRAGAD